jgi:acetoin utilization protein AcuC
VADFKPDAIILQCGADAVLEDPLSRLSLSNNSHWRTVAALRPLAPRYLVLGGGGYNPWSVGRLWAGVWATLCCHDIPDRLPPPARSVLAALSWRRSPGRQPPEHWIDSLKDPWRHGPVRDSVRSRVAFLRGRLAAQGGRAAGT